MRELLALTSDLPEIALESDHVLVREGEPADDLYVLVRGQLVVRRNGQDFVSIDDPGSCVGELAVLLERPHTSTVATTVPTVVRVIHDARRVLGEDPATLHAVATLLARRLDLINRYLTDLQHQYRDVESGLGLVGDVLHSLATYHGDELDPGSEREPDPLY
jgi:CRP/FNR family transcriptional regulator, cyclic AMP receptor protein